MHDDLVRVFDDIMNDYLERECFSACAQRSRKAKE